MNCREVCRSIKRWRLEALDEPGLVFLPIAGGLAGNQPVCINFTKVEVHHNHCINGLKFLKTSPFGGDFYCW